MSLQFIFGNSGSGKSHCLYQNIIEQSIRYPEKNYLVLVPEQFTMQTQKDLCLMHPRGGIMNIDVLSFGRLAHRVFEEVGQDNRTVLDDEGKNLILRKIAGNYEDELTVLKGNLKKQGYISEVKSVISEFTQYGVDFERLDEFMDSISPDSYLYYKLKDIRKVYEGFEDYLSEKYITKEEMLDVLSDAVPRSNILKGSVVAMDGFTGFTPVQDRLLGELLKVCDKVMITVEMDEREDPFVYRHPYQLFALSKQMVTSLVKIARDTKTEMEDPVYLYQKPPKRFEHNAELAFLESELFRYSGNQYLREDEPGDERSGYEGAVSIHEARNPRAEAQYVAEGIRYLVREKGYRYRDVAVITADMNVYADALEKACGMFDIPVFMDHKKSILLNAFVEYLRSLLAMAEENFTYDSVFRFLRTGLCGFTYEEVDRMENYCLALGIKGYKKWQQAWVRQTSEAGEAELQELNHLRVRFVEKIQNLVFVLKQRKKTVRDVTLAVYEFISEEKMQEQLSEMEQKFQEKGELALAKEYAQIYRIVLELFDKFVELLGDEQISLKEYCDLLDAGLEEAKVGVIPPSLDQVVIGDVERTRIKNIKALFFVGANDTLLPGNASARGILSERDREQFLKGDIALSPGPKEEAYIQKFYLYMNLTKPSEYLYLSWSKVSGDGKSLRPAYLISDIRRLFPGLRTVDEEKRAMAETELTRKTGILKVAEGIRDRRSGVDGDWKELYTWFWRDDKSKETLEEILDAGFLRREYPELGPERAKQLYPDPDRVSVTRMEQFASCAYAHFLSYGLRLSDRAEYSFEAMDLGNIAHQSLERFSRKADREKMRWEDLPEELRDELIDESVEESVIDYGNTVLFSSARNEYMIARIKRLIRRSVWALTKQLEKGDFVPGGYEMKFGSGKIDRIDICEDDEGVYVKVTDYKTGMKSFDITALYHGLQMQLPVYLNAALAVEKRKYPDKEIIPAGIFYYRIQDPVVDRKESDEDVEKSILKELRLDGLVNGDEKVISHLERNLIGSSLLIPVGRNKDGTLSKNSRALPGDTFRAVLKYAQEKEKKICAEIRAGEVSAAPYEMGGDTGCDYCVYRDICGFDIRIEGCKYRRLEKYSMEEVIAKMMLETERRDGGAKG
ncbi:MAG TPA: PD-(D/E)XK nuclease family protein [Candidatus Mediterraneibacter intestinigallinarum]|nr:PD-(D/E)XK nuclease family protein [Candidatus Mediterraneibacter intestinigallinarum]